MCRSRLEDRALALPLAIPGEDGTTTTTYCPPKAPPPTVTTTVPGTVPAASPPTRLPLVVVLLLLLLLLLLPLPGYSCDPYSATESGGRPQAEVPTGHIMVPGRKAQHTPLACLQGPLDPGQHPSQAAPEVPSPKGAVVLPSVNAVHSTAPTGHTPSPKTLAAYGAHSVDAACWQGPEVPWSQGGHTLTGGAVRRPTPHSKLPWGHLYRLASPYATQAPEGVWHGPAVPAPQLGQVHWAKPGGQEEVPATRAAHTPLVLFWHGPLVPK